MKKLARNKLFVFVIVVWFIFWPISFLVAMDDLIELTIWMVITSTMGIIYTYSHGLRDIFFADHRRDMDNADFVILAIMMFYAAETGRFLFSWYWRVFANGDMSLLNSKLNAFLFWTIFTAGVLSLVAPRINDKKARIIPWPGIALIVLTGFALGLTSLILF